MLTSAGGSGMVLGMERLKVELARTIRHYAEANHPGAELGRFLLQHIQVSEIPKGSTAVDYLTAVLRDYLYIARDVGTSEARYPSKGYEAETPGL